MSDLRDVKHQDRRQVRRAVVTGYDKELGRDVQMALSLAASSTPRRVQAFRQQIWDLEVIRRELQKAGIQRGADPAAIGFLRAAYTFTHGRLDRMEFFRQVRAYVATKNGRKETG